MEFWLWVIIAIGTYAIGYHNGHQSGFIDGAYWKEFDTDEDDLGSDNE